ncbi:MFS transporter [Kitasatospora azatica]|uniref:MFS transporter n=1 Tax=Kitasatospora azatica TaxID=58347 RepID=UPI0007C76007|nr:MFS transporter [Kitasatospora azatica]
MRIINGDFTRLWSGQAISLTGDFVFDTTLTLWVGTSLVHGGAAPLAVSGLLVTVALAALLVAPIAGVFVDRWGDHRRTMMGADLVRAVLIGVVSVLAFLPKGTVPTTVLVTVVYLAVFLNTAVSQFFNPARFAIVAEVVPEEQRTKAAGIGQTTQAIAGIVGPPLAAPLLFTAGTQWALLINALSYVGSFLLVRGVRATVPAAAAPGQSAGLPAELRDGLREAAGNRVVKVLLTAIVLISVGIGALNTVNLFFVTDNLGVDKSFYGTLDMALGLGMLGGAVLVTPLATRYGHRVTFALGLAVMGLLLLGYARMTSFWPAVALIAALGVALIAVNAAVAPLVMGAVPKEFLGRVFSAFNPVQQVASLIGMAAAGPLAANWRYSHTTLGGLHIGGIDTILTGSALLVLAGGVYAVLGLREPATAPVEAVPQPD